jgi:hypothetical protein
MLAEIWGMPLRWAVSLDGEQATSYAVEHIAQAHVDILCRQRKNAKLVDLQQISPTLQHEGERGFCPNHPPTAI